MHKGKEFVDIVPANSRDNHLSVLMHDVGLEKPQWVLLLLPDGATLKPQTSASQSILRIGTTSGAIREAFLENVWGRPDRQTHVFSGRNIMCHNQECLVLSNDKTSLRDGFMSGWRVKEGERSLEEDMKIVTW
jgi:hypothetical protein